MRTIVITGTQWGDEGKGKIVDMLTQKADIVVRYQGGNNAGHTIVIGNNKFALHLLPSGILREGKLCYIGSDVVVNPEELLEEIKLVEEKGIKITEKNLKISKRANLILDYHKQLDKARENAKKENKIGTTGRGIGPAYEDKVARVGVRIVDLFDKSILKNRITLALKEKNELFEKVYNEKRFDIEELVEKYFSIGKKIEKFVENSNFDLNNYAQNKTVLIEGAQGALLDVDFGTYPFVTSSNTLSTHYATGSGLRQTQLTENIGLVKAYTTRVGSGPFPTKDKTDAGKYLAEKGHEKGTTTGRLRDCGWLDFVALKHIFSLSNFTTIALTKLDVLSGLKKIKFCVAYNLDGTIIKTFPATAEELERVIPIYEEIEGWNENITKIKKYDNLPKNAKKYIELIEKQLSVPVNIISVGPDRNETILKTQIF